MNNIQSVGKRDANGRGASYFVIAARPSQTATAGASYPTPQPLIHEH